MRFEFEPQPDGESDWQIIVRLLDAGVVMAFHLVFPSETHLFTVAPHFNHWVEILQPFCETPARNEIGQNEIDRMRRARQQRHTISDPLSDR